MTDHRIGLLLLLGVTLAGYAGAWHAGFVWDDVPLVVQNDALGVEASLSALFTQDLWSQSGAGEVSSGYYRPLVLLSFALDRVLFGLQPAGYHLHSILWHLAAVSALYWVLMELFGRSGALVGGAWFALHPVQSEVVVWIAARNDLMAAALGFVALGLLIRVERVGRARLVAAAGITALACLSKETAFVLPVMLLIVDLARGVNPRNGNTWQRVGALAAGVGCVLVARVWVDVGAATLPTADGWALLARNAAGVAASLGAAVVSPWPLSSARDLSWLGAEPAWRGVVALVGLVTLVVVIVLAQREQRRWIGAGLAWAVILLALAAVPIADKGGLGDRFLYWPMAGGSIVLAAVAGHAWRWLPLAIAVPALVILNARMPDWSHDRRLWGAAVRDVPSPTNHVSFGHALTLHERHKRAHVSFVTSIAGSGLDVEACPRIVGSAMRTGLPKLAYRMGSWAQERGCPVDAEFVGWMALAAAATGQWAEARTWAQWGLVDDKGHVYTVRATLARRAGDEDAYRATAQSWDQVDVLGPRVDALLRRAKQPRRHELDDR